MKSVKTASTMIAFILLASCTSNSIEENSDIVNKTLHLTELLNTQALYNAF